MEMQSLEKTFEMGTVFNNEYKSGFDKEKETNDNNGEFSKENNSGSIFEVYTDEMDKRGKESIDTISEEKILKKLKEKSDQMPFLRRLLKRLGEIEENDEKKERDDSHNNEEKGMESSDLEDDEGRKNLHGNKEDRMRFNFFHKSGLGRRRGRWGGMRGGKMIRGFGTCHGLNDFTLGSTEKVYYQMKNHYFFFFFFF
jgi:hypothetical protein